jgi:hypothetical protein
MGLESALYKKDKNEKYYLGKGLWSSVFEDIIVDSSLSEGKTLKEIKMNVYDNLYCSILEHIAHNFELKTRLQYFNDMAEDIIKWCQDDPVFLINDMKFDDIYHDAKETGDCFKIKKVKIK